MLIPSGNPFECHGEVLNLQPMIPPKHFDSSFPPDWGMLRRSRHVQSFLSKKCKNYCIQYNCEVGATERGCSGSIGSDDTRGYGAGSGDVGKELPRGMIP